MTEMSIKTRKEIEEFLDANPRLQKEFNVSGHISSWISQLTPYQRWTCWCTWNGLMGWPATLIDKLKECGYKVEEEK